MWKFITQRARAQTPFASATRRRCVHHRRPTPSHAAVEYEKVCSLYGAGFFYIPGTDTCVNARQILDDQFDIARELTRPATGTAMATALVNPFLPDGH